MYCISQPLPVRPANIRPYSRSPKFPKTAFIIMITLASSLISCSPGYVLRAAWEDSNGLKDVTLAYAGALIEANRLDEAAGVLDGVRLVDRDALHEQLMAQIELKRQAGKSPEIEALETELAADEDNHAVRVQLAVQLSASDHHKEALEHLLTVLRIDRDWNNGEAKRLYLDTLATIGKGDPLAAEYQRKLFSILY